jgi:hypothetical protein
MSNSENEIKNLEFLVVKSRELLQEQLKAYENYTSKSGILISVSSLFIVNVLILEILLKLSHFRNYVNINNGKICKQ